MLRSLRRPTEPRLNGAGHAVTEHKKTGRVATPRFRCCVAMPVRTGMAQPADYSPTFFLIASITASLEVAVTVISMPSFS